MKFQNNHNAILSINSKVPYLIFPSLSKINFIKHGFSTRLGGVSKSYFESMNLGFNRGDQEDKVYENYRRICDSIGISMNDLVLSDQVHNTDIRLITADDKGKGIIKERDYQGVDGLITNTPGVPLVTFYADCVPLYFVDMKNHAIGLSHSGWRGTVDRMGLATLKAMNYHFNTEPEDVKVLIGPSICKDCYEVSKDVVDEFQKVFNHNQMNDIIEEKENNKYQLDLWKANSYILQDAGVKLENINISEVCTCCNSDLLFSHRASGGKRGTLAAFLELEEE